MMDEEAGAQVKALIAKAALEPGAFDADDCRATYKELSKRGVTFLTEPTALLRHRGELRDNSGNWFSMTQRTEARVAR
jgi:hypothetical protein